MRHACEELQAHSPDLHSKRRYSTQRCAVLVPHGLCPTIRTTSVETVAVRCRERRCHVYVKHERRALPTSRDRAVWHHTCGGQGGS